MTEIEGIEGEFEVTPEELSAMFGYKEWLYATPSLGYGKPTPESIQQLILELVEEIFQDGRPGVLASRGRFMAVRHEDDQSANLYLNIGYVWPTGLDDGEEEYFEGEE